ncbi:MAG: hypothetical protein HYY84_02160 [Deltaproteobacteria bacterium]|nr:hypothetical protein [Deltaproteobacteria bacterium]
MTGESSTRAFVLFSSRAGGGGAAQKWSFVRPIVERAFVPIVVEHDDAGLWRRAVCEALEHGVAVFVAAGGDGTVNALLNAVVGLRGSRALDALTLGAVGLGSSNDFHKPFHRLERGIPLTIDLAARRSRDVCRLHFMESANNGSLSRSRLFIVSASVGIVANANAAFNDAAGLQSWLKSRSTSAAILYAATRTILNHRNIVARLTLDGLAHKAAITNLSILKTPFVSGSFRFDSPVAPDNGLLSVNLCDGMTRGEALRTLFDLSHGRFLGRPKRRNWQVASLAVDATQPFAVELDGEVVTAARAEFSVLGERIGVCG